MISIIIPFHNEEKSISLLQKNLIRVCDQLKKEYELVFVNDGSTDLSEHEIRKDTRIKLINHRKRYGKGRALASGCQIASGELIVFMDADLQDDPDDIPRFLAKINQGYELVNGVRMGRKDGFLIKSYSYAARLFLQKFLRSPFTDVNCGFKAFRREVLNGFIFYGNNFRFFPLAAYYQGYRVTEIPVANHERKYGTSKFGVSKIFTGIFDTLTALFIFQFSEKPLQFFGPIGGILLLIGSIITFVLAVERIFFGMLLYRRVLLLYGILFIIVGLQVIMTGILAELFVYLHKKQI